MKEMTKAVKAVVRSLYPVGRVRICQGDGSQKHNVLVYLPRVMRKNVVTMSALDASFRALGLLPQFSPGPRDAQRYSIQELFEPSNPHCLECDGNGYHVDDCPVLRRDAAVGDAGPEADLGLAAAVEAARAA